MCCFFINLLHYSFPVEPTQRNMTGLISKPGICMRGVELPQNEVGLKICPLLVAPGNFLTHPWAFWNGIG